MKSQADLERELYATQKLKNELTKSLKKEVPESFEDYPYFFTIHRQYKDKLPEKDFDLLMQCFSLNRLQGIEEVLKYALEVSPYNKTQPEEDTKRRIKENFVDIPYHIRYSAETYFGIYIHDVRKAYYKLGMAYKNKNKEMIEEMTTELKKFVSF